MKRVITDEIATRIKQLRAIGIGYGMIATKTGLKVDTVKKYCKRQNIAGYLGGVAEEEVEFVKLNYGNINCD